MKKRFFLLLAIIATFVLTSCKIDGYQEYPPSILVEKSEAKLNSDSTIMIKIAQDHSAFVFDSLHVADTVSFNVILNAYYNQIKELYITPSDSTAVKFIQPDSISYFILPTSLPEKGIYYPKEKTYGLYFPIKFTTLKAKESFTYTIRVVSDVTKTSNMSSIDFKFPIKQKK